MLNITLTVEECLLLGEEMGELSLSLVTEQREIPSQAGSGQQRAQKLGSENLRLGVCR